MFFSLCAQQAVSKHNQPFPLAVVLWLVEVHVMMTWPEWDGQKVPSVHSPVSAEWRAMGSVFSSVGQSPRKTKSGNLSHPWTTCYCHAIRTLGHGHVMQYCSKTLLHAHSWQTHIKVTLDRQWRKTLRHPCLTGQGDTQQSINKWQYMVLHAELGAVTYS